MKKLHRAACLLALTAAGFPAGAMAAPAGEEDPGAALYGRRDAQDYLAAQKDAREMLAHDPGLVPAMLVLAHIARRQGHHAEALKWSQAAVTATAPARGAETAPAFRWNTLALYHLAQAQGMMNRREEQLDTLRRYFAQGGSEDEVANKVPRPGRLLEAEALMKLGRASEALSLAQDQLKADPANRVAWEWQSQGARLILEPESREVMAWVVGQADAAHRPEETLLHLSALQRRIWGDLEGARADYLKAAKAPNPASATNCARELACIHLRLGEWSEAVQAISQGWRMIALKDPSLQQDLFRDMRVSGAEALLQLGYADAARDLMEGVLEDPPRLGGSLLQGAQWASWALVVQWNALDASARLPVEGAEQGLARSWIGGPDAALRKAALRTRLEARLREQCTAPAKPRDALALVRNDPLLWMQLPRIIGPGASEALLAGLPLKGDGNKAFEPAFRAEIAWQRGRTQEACQLATSALQTIPASEAPLRARMMAILARADPSKAAAWCAAAWQLQPAVFLLFGERIPAEAGGAHTLLGQEPALGRLLEASQAGVPVALEASAGAWEAAVGPAQKPLARRSIKSEGNLRRVELSRFFVCALGALDASQIAALQGRARLR